MGRFVPSFFSADVSLAARQDRWQAQRAGSPATL
jgi:hypothetical protein